MTETPLLKQDGYADDDIDMVKIIVLQHACNEMEAWLFLKVGLEALRNYQKLTLNNPRNFERFRAWHIRGAIIKSKIDLNNSQPD